MTKQEEDIYVFALRYALGSKQADSIYELICVINEITKRYNEFHTNNTDKFITETVHSICSNEKKNTFLTLFLDMLLVYKFGIQFIDDFNFKGCCINVSNKRLYWLASYEQETISSYSYMIVAKTLTDNEMNGKIGFVEVTRRMGKKPLDVYNKVMEDIRKRKD